MRAHTKGKDEMGSVVAGVASAPVYGRQTTTRGGRRQATREDG